MNRLSYDTCAYAEAVTQSVSPISFILDPIKYEHCSKCRPELGIVGGTAVSHVSGSLVDLENNLIGLDRPGTQCSSLMFAPPKTGDKPDAAEMDSFRFCGQRARPRKKISYVPSPRCT